MKIESEVIDDLFYRFATKNKKMDRLQFEKALKVFYRIENCRPAMNLSEDGEDSKSVPKITLEEKVKCNLLARGFKNETLLNNRGLLGAAIDETININREDKMERRPRHIDYINSVGIACGIEDVLNDTKQYSRAQDRYIDYLESIIKKTAEGNKESGKSRLKIDLPMELWMRLMNLLDSLENKRIEVTLSEFINEKVNSDHKVKVLAEQIELMQKKVSRVKELLIHGE